MVAAPMHGEGSALAREQRNARKLHHRVGSRDLASMTPAALPCVSDLSDARTFPSAVSETHTEERKTSAAGDFFETLRFEKYLLWTVCSHDKVPLRESANNSR